MPLPEVHTEGGPSPYVLASRYPNGAICVATLERLLLEEHTWTIPRADITLQMGNAKGPVGIFGLYRSLKLCYEKPLPANARIWAQDLIGKQPVDITSEVEIIGNTLTFPGSLLERIGTQASHPGDESAPGLVVVADERKR
jgi:hypothetical protein